MMIETLISMVRYLSARKDDDFADRMNYLYTPNLLLAFSVLISFKQFGGRPLECMFPNKFPGSWEQYAENFCWSEDTYYLPPEVHVAQIHESERYSAERKLSYYQWVPFFLLLQAACFRLPSILWKVVSLSSGVRVHDICTKALDSQNMEETSRLRTLQVLAAHLSRALRFQHQIMRRHLFIHKTLRFLNITYSACFITIAYLGIKMLYLGNVLAQLYLMNKFLETDRYQWYGFSVIQDIMAGIPWHTSGYFPRVSLCDFTVRQVANIQKYSVQCVLVINIFNEKIFILLWFWYGILLFFTSLSLIYWFMLAMFPTFGHWYVAQTLELSHMDPHALVQKAMDKKEKKHVRRFVDEFLKNDGVFTLRMLGIHTGILFTSELTAELYRLHEEMLQQNDTQTFSEDTTLKLEDGANHHNGGGPMPAFGDLGKRERSPTEKQLDREEKLRRPTIKRHKELAARDAADEAITALVPVANGAGNEERSSSSSSSSSSDHRDGNDDNDSNLSSRRRGT